MPSLDDHVFISLHSCPAYIPFIGMCGTKGRGFQAVLQGIDFDNWSEIRFVNYGK